MHANKWLNYLNLARQIRHSGNSHSKSETATKETTKKNDTDESYLFPEETMFNFYKPVSNRNDEVDNEIDVDAIEGYEIQAHKTFRTHVHDMMHLLHLKTKNNPVKQVQLIQGVQNYLLDRTFGEEHVVAEIVLEYLQKYFAHIKEIHTERHYNHSRAAGQAI